MKVWLVGEHHRAEGYSPVAVLAYEPSQEEAEALVSAHSTYSESERFRWCEALIEAFDLRIEPVIRRRSR